MGILTRLARPGGGIRNRPRAILWAAAALWASLAVLPACAASRNPGWLVSADDAAKAASALVAERYAAKDGGFAAWKDAAVGKPVLYFDSSGDPAAYCFTISAQGKAAGYAVISARKYCEPVQEFSSGKPPHELYLKASRAAAEASLGEGRKVREPSFLYAGPLAWVASFTAAEPRTPGETVLVSMRTQEVLAPDALREPARSAEELALTRASWAAVLSGKASEGGARPEFRYLANVPSGPFGCSGSPAALAALLSYWDMRANGETDSALCEAVSKALGESAGDLSAAAKGLAGARGKRLELARKSRGDSAESADFTGCRIEIGAGRPLLVRTGLPAAGAWTVCAGYLAGPSGRFLAVHDLRAADPAATGDAWARPGVVFCNWGCVGGLETLTGAP